MPSVNALWSASATCTTTSVNYWMPVHAAYTQTTASTYGYAGAYASAYADNSWQWMQEQARWQNLGYQDMTSRQLGIVQATPGPTTRPADGALKRARELLLEFLDDSQREDFEKSKSFILRTMTRRYRIKPGYKVEELGAGDLAIARFCIHPAYELECPPEDWALTQKLLIEADEEAFRRNANRSAA